MSDSGENFFRANKQTRQEAFSFKNQDPATFEAVLAGDQSARVHPFPAMLGPGQKIGNPHLEPSPEYTTGEHAGRQ